MNMTEESKMVKLLSDMTIYGALDHMNLTMNMTFQDYERFPNMTVNNIIDMLEVNRTEMPKEIELLGNMTLFEILKSYAESDITYQEYQRLPNMTVNEILATFNLSMNGTENLRVVDILTRIIKDKVIFLSNTHCKHFDIYFFSYSKRLHLI